MEDYRPLGPDRGITPMAPILTYFALTLGQTFTFAANIDVLLELICREKHPEIATSRLLTDPLCRKDGIAAQVASFSSYEPLIGGVLGVLLVPKLVDYSDQVGRKPILKWSAVAHALNDFIRFICVSFPDIVNYRWLIVAFILKGAGSSLQMVNSTYIADCTTSETRSQYLSLLDAFFFSALAIGPAIGSLFHTLIPDYSWQYLVTLLCDLGYIGMVIWVLRESRTKEAQLEARLSKENYHRSAWNIFRPLKQLTFSHVTNHQDRRNARILVALAALVADFGTAIGPLFMMYGEFRFNWTSVETGLAMTLFGVSRAVVLGIMFPAAVKFLNRRWPLNTNGVDQIDKLILRIGFMSSAVTCIAVSLAPTGALFLSGAVSDALASGLIPTLRAAILKYVEPVNTGKVMGALALLTGVTVIASTQIFIRLYQFTVSFHPQFAFEIASLCFLGLFMGTFTLKPTLQQYQDFDLDLGRI